MLLKYLLDLWIQLESSKQNATDDKNGNSVSQPNEIGEVIAGDIIQDTGDAASVGDAPLLFYFGCLELVLCLTYVIYMMLNWEFVPDLIDMEDDHGGSLRPNSQNDLHQAASGPSEQSETSSSSDERTEFVDAVEFQNEDILRSDSGSPSPVHSMDSMNLSAAIASQASTGVLTNEPNGAKAKSHFHQTDVEGLYKRKNSPGVSKAAKRHGSPSKMVQFTPDVKSEQPDLEPGFAFVLIRFPLQHVHAFRNILMKNYNVDKGYARTRSWISRRIQVIEGSWPSDKGITLLMFLSREMAQRWTKGVSEFRKEDWLGGVDLIIVPVQCQLADDFRFVELMDMRVFEYDKFEKWSNETNVHFEKLSDVVSPAVVACRGAQKVKGSWDPGFLQLNFWKSSEDFQQFYCSDEYRKFFDSGCACADITSCVFQLEPLRPRFS